MLRTAPLCPPRETGIYNSGARFASKFCIIPDLWATSNRFLAGHKLRLEISSSNFPRFDRNLNLREPSGTAKKIVTAKNSTLHDAAHPSAVIVPIL
jgi:predicted acyl esterase